MPDLLAEITATARSYYAQAAAFSLTATDFYDWLDSLPTARRADVLARGFMASQAEPDFLRFCLEWRGYDMWGFMSGPPVHRSLRALDRPRRVQRRPAAQRPAALGP